MYYKILRNGEIVDVLKDVVYVQYQRKHNILLICDISEAEAILSSDGTQGWHLRMMKSFEPDNTCYKSVEITKYEYEKILKTDGKTKEEIIDEYTKELIEGGLL